LLGDGLWAHLRPGSAKDGFAPTKTKKKQKKPLFQFLVLVGLKPDLDDQLAFFSALMLLVWSSCPQKLKTILEMTCIVSSGTLSFYLLTSHLLFQCWVVGVVVGFVGPFDIFSESMPLDVLCSQK